MAAGVAGRRDIPLLCEPRAVNTAENAVRSLELVRTIEGASEIVLVCSIRYFPRVRFLVRAPLPQPRLHTRYRYVSAAPVARARAPRAELDHADGARSAPRAAACSTTEQRDREPRTRPRLALPALAGDDNSVAMGLLFYPRGGSALVAAYLSRALKAEGWRVDARLRSLGPAGALGNAETFFAGVDTCRPRYDDAVARWRRGEDPMAAPFPMQPSYEEREGVPDRSFPRVSPQQGERIVAAWARLIGGIRRTAARAEVFHLHHLTPIHERPRRGSGRPDRDAPARHRAQDARQDRARRAGRRRGRARAVVGGAHAQPRIARPRRS